VKLRFGNNIPGPIEEVYEYVTGMGPDGPLDLVNFAQKYGEVLEQRDDAFLTRVQDGDVEVTWSSLFDYPYRRLMMFDSSSADREDIFEEVKGGTKWTIIVHSKKGGFPGLMQWLYFQVIGKFRIGVPVLSPAAFHFRRKAREAEREAADQPQENPDTED
jgi:hypothetical protein